MKLLIIGAGGVGSNFVEELCRCISQEQIDPTTEITIADDDIVELKQAQYQNFEYDDAGLNKAYALATRYKHFGVKCVKERIKTDYKLHGYDMFVLCVDNEPTRSLVIKYSFKHNKDFLDLRATGRSICAFPKLAKLEDNLKYLNVKDTNTYSCQDKKTLEQGRIDKGNKIIALCGVQMLLNKVRGMNNKVIQVVI